MKQEKLITVIVLFQAFCYINLNAQTTISDIDGNVYKTVVVGTQTWMAENLKVTKYNNGDLISTTRKTKKKYLSESEPKYQWAYDDKENNVETYGRLYTWYAVTDSRNVCPDGWHIPTEKEWWVLINGYADAPVRLTNANISADRLKESGTIHWESPNTWSTNETGFTALPGGYRDNFRYWFLSSYGYWWCAEGTSVKMTYEDRYADITNYMTQKNNGLSVRCIKD